MMFGVNGWHGTFVTGQGAVTRTVTCPRSRVVVVVVLCGVPLDQSSEIVHVINLGHFGKQFSLSLFLSKEGQVAAPADAKASWTPFWTKTAVGVRLVDRSRSGGRTSTFAVGVDGGMQRG